MKIYDYLDYKAFIKAYVKELPKEGRGEYGRLAKASQISSTLVSQVFNGDRDLTLEQSFLVSEYLNLSVDE
ncbi:MAG: helix-turn-helix domain-containing protein, partial [Bdellovibrionales bacterium]